MHIVFERVEELPIAVIIGYILLFIFTSSIFDVSANAKNRTCMIVVMHYTTGILIIAQLVALSLFFFAQLPTTRQIHLW